jgi:molybdopterin converting factor small subunit
MFDRRLLVPVALLVAAILAGIGYFAWSAAQKRAQQRQVVELVRDTTEKLRQGLAKRPSPELVAALEANLQAAKAPRDPALADAAEHYIIGAREIVRQRVEIERRERQAAASREALAGHMAGAAHRNSGWLRDAIALKKRVEEDHFNLNLSLKALDEVLYSMPDAEKRLQPHVDPALLVPIAETESARKQARAEAERAAVDLQRVRNINP